MNFHKFYILALFLVPIIEAAPEVKVTITKADTKGTGNFSTESTSDSDLIISQTDHSAFHDFNDFIQSFTIIEPVTLKSLRLFLRPIRGGSAITVSVVKINVSTLTYEPETLGSLTIPRDSIPDNPEGSWVSETFENEVTLSESGSYGLIIDNISTGGSFGYNDYGAVNGNLLAAGRFWIFDKEDLGIGGSQAFDIAFQLFGMGGNQTIPLPKITQITQNGFVSTIEWKGLPGMRYAMEHSEDLKSWRVIRSRFGSRSIRRFSSETENVLGRVIQFSEGSLFFRVSPLGF